MKLTLGFVLLLSSCGGTAAPPAQNATPPAPTAAPPAQTAAPPAQPADAAHVHGTVTSMETGVGDPKAPALVFHVSFENDSGDTCEVRSYSLAWTSSPDAVRHLCPPQVTRLEPNGKAEVKCLVPDNDPMRNAMPDYSNGAEVVDIVATCGASPSTP